MSRWTQILPLMAVMGLAPVHLVACDFGKKSKKKNDDDDDDDDDSSRKSRNRGTSQASYASRSYSSRASASRARDDDDHRSRRGRDRDDDGDRYGGDLSIREVCRAVDRISDDFDYEDCIDELPGIVDQIEDGCGKRRASEFKEMLYDCARSSRDEDSFQACGQAEIELYEDCL